MSIAEGQAFQEPMEKLAEVRTWAQGFVRLNCDPMKMIPLPQNDVERTYESWGILAGSMDYLVEKANHVRLQEINLSYNVPSRLLNKMGLSSLRLYVQANNLFIITNNKYDEDPENPLGTYRLQPHYTFGFKLDF